MREPTVLLLCNKSILVFLKTLFSMFHSISNKQHQAFQQDSQSNFRFLDYLKATSSKDCANILTLFVQAQVGEKEQIRVPPQKSLALEVL